MYIFSITTILTAKKQFINDFPLPNHTVSIIIPARNEEKVIDRLLDCLTKQDYPSQKMEILVINDSSTDKTSEIAHHWKEKYPELIRVIDREKGGIGKAHVMNQAIKESKNEIILVFDADYSPAPCTVSRLVRWFHDPKIGLVQGHIHVHNSDENLLTKIITAERVGGFSCDLLARDVLKVSNQYGGTVGGFRRNILEKVGKWKQGVFSEDTDLTCRALIAGYRVKYDVSVRCGEEAPDTYKAYSKQRYRWVRGHTECGLRYTWQMIKTPCLSFREKLEGVFWINIMSSALCVLASFVVWVTRLAFGFPAEILSLNGVVAFNIFMIMSLGSIVAVGCYIQNDYKYLKYFPLLILLAYPMCFFTALKAFIHILFNRKRQWEKTERSGKVCT